MSAHTHVYFVTHCHIPSRCQFHLSLLSAPQPCHHAQERNQQRRPFIKAGAMSIITAAAWAKQDKESQSRDHAEWEDNQKVMPLVRKVVDRKACSTPRKKGGQSHLGGKKGRRKGNSFLDSLPKIDDSLFSSDEFLAAVREYKDRAYFLISVFICICFKFEQVVTGAFFDVARLAIF